MAFVLAAAGPGLFFEPANFVRSLRCMGVGMGVVFTVIGLIVLAVTLVNYLSSE